MAGLTCHLFNSEPSLPLLCTSGAPFTSLEHSFDPFKAEYDSSGSSYKVQHETDIFLIYLMDGYWYMAGPKSKTISYINISGKGGGIVLQVVPRRLRASAQPPQQPWVPLHIISPSLHMTHREEAQRALCPEPSAAASADGSGLSSSAQSLSWWCWLQRACWGKE